MAVVAFASGTTNSIIGTEQFLSNVNLSGVYTFHVNTLNMAAGDVLEMRVLQMVLTGTTAYVAYYTMFSGVQPVDDRIKISIPISNELADAQSLGFSIKQTFGGVKAYDWKVLRHV